MSNPESVEELEYKIERDHGVPLWVLDAFRRAVRLETWREAAEQICPHCKDGRYIAQRDSEGLWGHGKGRYCGAGWVQNRIAELEAE